MHFLGPQHAGAQISQYGAAALGAEIEGQIYPDGIAVRHRRKRS
jgi:hypothetical protein